MGKEFTKVELRLLAYEKAHGMFALAIEYATFLCKCKDRDDLQLRIKAIDLQEGKPIDEVKAVYSFLTGAFDK